MSVFKQRLVLWLLILLAVLVAFSSHPLIVDISRSAGIEKGSILSRYIIVVFAFLFALCFKWKEITQSKTIRVYFCFVLWILVFSILTIGFFSDKKLFGEVRAVVICLVALSIGWQLFFSDKQIRIVLLVYAISTLYVGLIQIMTNVGGFVIIDQLLTDNKNALGVMLASSVVIFVCFATENHSKKIWSVLYWVGSFVLFVILLTIRARAATLTAAFSVLLILYRKINKSYFILIVIALLVLFGLGVILFPNLYGFVLNSFVSGYEGVNITSGRSIRNQMALDYLSLHPLLGNLQHGVKIGWVHNYPLLQLFNNGFVFALPILSLYLYLFVIIIKGVFWNKVNNIRVVGFFAALVPFVVSLAEPTFPFGPGTATVFNFILLGVAIKYLWSART